MWVILLSSHSYHQLNSCSTPNDIGIIYFQNFHEYTDLIILIKVDKLTFGQKCEGAINRKIWVILLGSNLANLFI